MFEQYYNSESDKLIENLRRTSGILSVKELNALLIESRRHRVSSFDDDSRSIATRFNGKQKNVLKEALSKQFPRTFESMPIDPVNWLKFFAVQDSGVYDSPPKRILVDASGAKLPDDDERQKYFTEQLKKFCINQKMMLMERRANAGLKSSILSVGYSNIDGSGKLIGRMYWPHDVLTMTHEMADDDTDALWFVALRQNRLVNDKPLWLVWTREIKETANGVEYSPWFYRLAGEGSDSQNTAAVQYAGNLLPVVFLRTEDTNGAFWPEIDSDIVLNVDNLNIGRSNRQHVVNMQAHSMRVYKGDMNEVDEIPSAPDSVIKIGREEGFEAIPFDANHNAIESSAKRDLNELAVSRGNSPDSYAVEPKGFMSGVAKVIANAPHDKRIADMMPIFHDFEETQLLPVVIDVLDTFSDGPLIQLNAVIEPVEKPPFEDGKIKTDRVAIMRQMHVVSRAEARVILGLSNDMNEATRAIELIDAEIPAPVSSLDPMREVATNDNSREEQKEPD